MKAEEMMRIAVDLGCKLEVWTWHLPNGGWFAFTNDESEVYGSLGRIFVANMTEHVWRKLLTRDAK